eukprot:TRINITY_DN11013_c0_g1_i2.p2 TRINITY_DN11013_c0_g1~~TRINITY_DN11013_c0_g1_i2.p2  ORF type:complete len:121 (-),score=3.95 TRINITY_DN11013_c0_g1_i2:401-763(-)
MCIRDRYNPNIYVYESRFLICKTRINNHTNHKCFPFLKHSKKQVALQTYKFLHNLIQDAYLIQSILDIDINKFFLRKQYNPNQLYLQPLSCLEWKARVLHTVQILFIGRFDLFGLRVFQQ